MAFTEARRSALRFGFARGCARWQAGVGRGLIEMRNIAGWIAQNGVAPSGLLLDEARACHRLAALLPAATDDAETRAACRAPLADAAGEWERCCDGQAIALMRFHEAALKLAAAAQNGRCPVLAELTAGIAAGAAWLRRRPERMGPEALHMMSATLALAGDAIVRTGARDPVDAALFAAAVADRLEQFMAFRQAAGDACSALPAAPALCHFDADTVFGHVALLQQTLSGPASVPGAAGIGAAQRLAANFAGAGIAAAHRLARALESALLRHAQAGAVPDEAARMLFARAVGALDGMTGAIASQRSPAVESGLVGALEALRPTAGIAVKPS